MHKKAMECAKRTLEEFSAISEPTCEQAKMFADVMTGFAKFVMAEKDYNIIEAMKEAEEEEKVEAKMNSRMGYDNWRYRSGRFAPKGRGHLVGFMPEEDDYMEEYIGNPAAFKHGMRMGYPITPITPVPADMPAKVMGYMGNGKGDNYNSYQTMRRHYTDNPSDENKQKMDNKAHETAIETIDILKELWKNGDPKLRDMLRTNVSNMLNNDMH